MSLARDEFQVPISGPWTQITFFTNSFATTPSGCANSRACRCPRAAGALHVLLNSLRFVATCFSSRKTRVTRYTSSSFSFITTIPFLIGSNLPASCCGNSSTKKDSVAGGILCRAKWKRWCSSGRALNYLRATGDIRSPGYFFSTNCWRNSRNDRPVHRW